MCLVCLLLCKEECSCPVSLQLLRGEIWTCIRCPCLCFVGFWDGTMFANFHMCGIMLVLRAFFHMLVRNASPKRPMYFRCLMFSLSRPCELLVLLCFIAMCIFHIYCVYNYMSVTVSVMLFLMSPPPYCVCWGCV